MIEIVLLALVIVLIAAVAGLAIVARRRLAAADERFDAIDRTLAEIGDSVAALGAQQSQERARNHHELAGRLEALRAAVVTRIDERTAALRVGKQSVDQRARRGVARDAHALLTLHNRFPLGAESLELTSFSADPATILHLTTLVAALPDNARVVELGSGLSTVWMAAAAAREGRGIRIISFDHDERWGRETREALSRLDLEGVAEVRLAPLEPLPEAEPGDVPWYAVGAMADLPLIDLLVVDGPPAATGAYARRPAVPVLEPRLQERATVVLDDTDREEEAALVVEWSALLEHRRSVSVEATLERTTLLRLAPPGDREAAR